MKYELIRSTNMDIPKLIKYNKITIYELSNF